MEVNQMNEEKSLSSSWYDDDTLMLMLCVRPEKLDDPSRWCREMRAYAQASINGPKTSAEADELFAMMERLRHEANGEWSPNGD
jgi:hypothetical protein